METDYFYLKNLKLQNQYSSFKINTDGVLLACWVEATQSKEGILEIGTGTGVIPAILKRRFPDTLITTVEIDKASCEEAKVNFKLNGLDDIIVINGDIYAFGESQKKEYDHIITNPPYFINSSLPENLSLRESKHSTSLNILDIPSLASKLLNEQGRVSVILPFDLHRSLELKMAQFDFYLTKHLRVRGRYEKPFIRSLMCFENHQNSSPLISDMTLFSDDNRTKTREYFNLIKEVQIEGY